MNQIIKLDLFSFSLVYLLLIIVLLIMKKAKVNQTKLLLVASIRMSLQLVLAGYVLLFIFEHPNPITTMLYFSSIVGFAIHRVLSRNKWLNREFKYIIGLTIALSGFSIVAFFVLVVVKTNLFNPQYLIPLSGMIVGNSMTGLNLGLKSFKDSMESQRPRIETLLNLGVKPIDILIPISNNALETALLPTLNSMLGMGIVSLPGMMTGQILSGTVPTTAIVYQIAIMISITTVVSLTVFITLFFGVRTLINKRQQIELITANRH